MEGSLFSEQAVLFNTEHMCLPENSNPTPPSCDSPI